MCYIDCDLYDFPTASRSNPAKAAKREFSPPPRFLCFEIARGFVGEVRL